MSTYRNVYDRGRDTLKAAGITEYELDARLLLEYVCGTDRNTLLAHPEREVSIGDEEIYFKLLKKRGNHIPLQQITGTQDFMGLTFRVSDKVLIPRQDTECLVEEVMTYAEDGMRVLDMCTGSGCILISLMHYRYLEGVGCDVSEDALAVARENAGILEDGEPPVFLCGDMFEPLSDSRFSGHFDIIVSNPPYIKSEVIPTLMEEVRDHDPQNALDGGADGLDFYRIIADKAPYYLTNYGRLYLEIGYDQAEAVPRLLEDAGFSSIEVKKDYGGNPRVVSAVYIR